MAKLAWTLWIKTVSEANCSEHWQKKAQRHRQQQFFIRQLFKNQTIALPCAVTLIRLSSKTMDDDNLRFALKWIRDEISECLLPELRKTYINKKGKICALKGRADDDPRITWLYSQEKARVKGIRIEIDPR